MEKLENYELDLALCDEIIISALRMRFQISQDQSRYRFENSLPLFDVKAEKKEMDNFMKKLKGAGDSDSILHIMDSILNESRKMKARESLNCNIFLIGFMGAGKSTISKELLDRYGLDVIEMDQIIAERNGMSIPEIFKQLGEEYFRQEETRLLSELKDRKNVVVSCGGGAAMRQVNVDEMKKSGKIVLLTADPSTILSRVENSHDRPLLENNKTVPYITQLMEARKPAYEGAADLKVITDNRPASEIADEIVCAVSSLCS